MHDPHSFQNCGTFQYNNNNKYHIFERNDDHATVFLKWTDFNLNSFFRNLKKNILFFISTPYYVFGFNPNIIWIHSKGWKVWPPIDLKKIYELIFVMVAFGCWTFGRWPNYYYLTSHPWANILGANRKGFATFRGHFFSLLAVLQPELS